MLAVLPALTLPGSAALAAGQSRALVAFLPAHEDPAYSVPPPGGEKPGATEVLVDELAAEPGLSLGLVSTSQGGYTPQQAVLDLSQGTRTAPTAYGSDPPVLDLAGDGSISGWRSALRRASGSYQSIEPGLLAASVPGGAAYAGAAGGQHLDAAVAADRDGHVAAESLGSASSVAARARALLLSHRLVVADLPPDGLGRSELSSLIGTRRPGTLLIVMQRPPASGAPLVPIGVDAGAADGGLDSPTTHLHGLVAGIDVAPTILRALHRPLPAAMRGQAITVAGPRDAAATLSLKTRLGEIEGRRMPTLVLMLVVWAVLALAVGAALGQQRARRPVLRIGGLAFMWLPVAVLVGAALRPGSGTLESLTIAAVGFGLAALSDRLVPWPRAPIVPAAGAVIALTTVLASGSTLLATSLLGPDPSFGARFFGIGNELKSGLTVLVLVAAAAALGPHASGRRVVATFVIVGVLLGVLLGSGRLGAGVGGVIIVAAATAAAVLAALPGRRSPRAVVIAAVSIPVALAALAGLDLLTAGGSGHLSHDVLAVHSSNNLPDIVIRRYKLAYGAYTQGMPVAAALAALAVVCGLSNRGLFARPATTAWRAALIGGLVGGVVGALTEDSGPLLLVVAVFMLACVTAYARGEPSLARAPDEPATRAAT